MIPRFRQYEPTLPPRAVVLVVHGLNLHPERMTPVCTLLQSLGVRVVRMALAGHRGDYGALQEVTRESWLEDYRAAVPILASAAQSGRSAAGGPTSPAELPVGFLGQSLGALTFCDFVLAAAKGRGSRLPVAGVSPLPRPSALFARALFLSPAIALRPSAQLLRPLAALTRRLPIPSASSPEDRLYPRLPAAAYRALYTSYRAVRSGLRESSVPVASTVVMHPRDELISRRGIEYLIAEKRLVGSRLVLLEPDGAARGTSHLAVCAETMGDANWRRFEEVAAGFVDALR
jgi:alpha-beta hydrolase superfamily lysophospholipase